MPVRTALVLAAVCAAVATEALAVTRSLGCGAPPAPPRATFEVGSRQRHAIIVLPQDYRADRPQRLIFAFHGRTNDNDQARRYLGLEEAAQAPTIFVYPAGLTDRTGRFTWADPGDPPDALRDFTLFDVLLGRITSTYCIDLDAVYVVGHSLGASFANSLACARAQRIRGVASVAGGITPSDCPAAVAALLLHNPHDRVVPVSEGRRARDVLLGHPGTEHEAVDARIGAFPCRRYGDEGTPVLWCLHGQDITPRGRYYPHQWPQGAAPAIIEFFDILLG
jgi:polyhydroxybutyrate depolymerase